jgi:hypothetical protein
MERLDTAELRKGFGTAAGRAAQVYAYHKALTAAADEIDRLRTGDTCGRACEGMAYRIEARRLRAAIRKTLDENGHLADGDVCTLIDLKLAIDDV